LNGDAEIRLRRIAVARLEQFCVDDDHPITLVEAQVFLRLSLQISACAYGGTDIIALNSLLLIIFD
jgi:hypothetical protein